MGLGVKGSQETDGSSPVDTGLGVSNLVEAGHPEAIGTPTLPFVHEVADGQDNF